MSVVERYDIPGVAGSSETTPIPEFILDDLDRRFEEIYVLHDGDTAGWESAAELSIQRKYTNIVLPEMSKVGKKIKDPSDYIKYKEHRLLDAIFSLYKLI